MTANVIFSKPKIIETKRKNKLKNNLTINSNMYFPYIFYDINEMYS